MAPKTLETRSKRHRQKAWGLTTLRLSPHHARSRGLRFPKAGVLKPSPTTALAGSRDPRSERRGNAATSAVEGAHDELHRTGPEELSFSTDFHTLACGGAKPHSGDFSMLFADRLRIGGEIP